MLGKFKKNRTELKNVCVFYDENTDSISLTSKDKRPTKKFGGFKLDLSSGRNSELILRSLLRDEGIISDKLLTPKDLSTMLPYPGSENLAWNSIPLGRTTSGPLDWYVNQTSHLLLVGNLGGGKTVLQRSIMFHCIQHSDDWRIFGIDLGRVDLAPYRKYSAVLDVATELDDSVKLLNYLHKEMQIRYKATEEAEVHNFRDLSESPPALMIMIEEVYFLLAKTEISTPEGKANDVLREEARSLIGDILRIGRSAGLYFCLTTRRPDAKGLPHKLKQCIPTRIVMGKSDSRLSNLTLGDDSATKLAPIKGRGYFQHSTYGEEFQAYFADPDWINRWLEEKESSQG